MISIRALFKNILNKIQQHNVDFTTNNLCSSVKKCQSNVFVLLP